jgi:hypothetical protein
MAVLVIPTVICVEIAELRRRPGASGTVYLKVRGGCKIANVFVPLQRDTMADLVLEEEPTSGEQHEAEEEVMPNAGFKGRETVKAHKFEATKIASLCCATPMALLQARRLLGNNVLLYHLDEAYMERTLKKTKASVAAGNQRSHIMYAVWANDKKEAEDQVKAAARTTTPWDGEGCGLLVFGVCYFKMLTIAAFNIIEALKLGAEKGIPLQDHVFAVGVAGESLLGLAIAVGTLIRGTCFVPVVGRNTTMGSRCTC